MMIIIYVMMMIIMIIVIIVFYTEVKPKSTSPEGNKDTLEKHIATTYRFGLLRCCRISGRRALVQMIALMEEILHQLIW